MASRLTLLTLFIVATCIRTQTARASHITSPSRLLTFLEQEGLFIEDEIIVDTGKENAFEHDQVTNNFTGKERIL